MTKLTAFIVPDVLTLLAACAKYPKGFVGVGARPKDMFCCPRVVGDRKSLQLLVKQYNFQSRSTQFFLLMPSADAACGIRWDEADPRCQACGLPVRDH